MKELFGGNTENRFLILEHVNIFSMFDWYLPKKIVNLNLSIDIKTYLGEDMQDRCEKLSSSDQTKLGFLVDRIKFIEHLRHIAKIIEKHSKTTKTVLPSEYKSYGIRKENKIEERDILETPNLYTYEFICEGIDLGGVHFDIEALIFYLLMTCIDTIQGKAEYLSVFDWLSSNQKLKGIQELTDDKITKKMKFFEEEYDKDFGLSKNFRKAFTTDLEETLKQKVSDSLFAVEINDKIGYLETKDIQKWIKLPSEKKLKKIADYLYGMRSKYTHSSIQTFIPDEPISRSLKLKGKYILMIKDINFVELMLEVIKSLIKSSLKPITE